VDSASVAESGRDDDAFVRAHEPLVRKLAHRIRVQLELSTELEELMAYGFRGLLEARQRFDADRGVRFETFAYYRIRGAILDGVRKMAYLPRRVHARRKAAAAQDRVCETAGETRVAGDGPPRTVEGTLGALDAALARTCAAMVLAAVGQSEEAKPRTQPEAHIVNALDGLKVRAALGVLPERERALVEGFYFEDRTLEEVGEELGISKSWASRLHTRALARLREVLGDP
jgi:RNA polymerase sigma factor for flagellar operon FliA